MSYYQIGTALTANHAHGSMMGVYGMMAIGLALFALRYIIKPDRWSDRLAKISFWATNIGLAWMVFVSLMPLGVLQLWNSVNVGYHDARELAYIAYDGNAFFEWLRGPGDIIFIIGAAAFVLITIKGVMHAQKPTLVEMEPETLFVIERPHENAIKAGLAEPEPTPDASSDVPGGGAAGVPAPLPAEPSDTEQGETA